MPSSSPQANGMVVLATTTTVSQPRCQAGDGRRLRNQMPMSRRIHDATSPTTSG